MRRWYSRRSRTGSSPVTALVPASQPISPAAIRRSVVLPAPLTPLMRTAVPPSRSRCTPSSTGGRSRRQRFTMPRISRTLGATTRRDTGGAAGSTPRVSVWAWQSMPDQRPATVRTSNFSRPVASARRGGDAWGGKRARSGRRGPCDRPSRGPVRARSRCARGADQAIVVRAAVEPVVAPASLEPVVSGAAAQAVDPRAAVKSVVAGAAGDAVGAGATEQTVVAAAADQHVAEQAAENAVVVITARAPDHAGARRDDRH